MIYFPWCDKGGRKGLMVLCISGKLLALSADFLNFMVEELVELKKRKSCCAPSPQSLVAPKENLCSQFWCIFTSTSFIQVVEWLWLDNVYEMCGGELEQQEVLYLHFVLDCTTSFYLLSFFSFQSGEFGMFIAAYATVSDETTEETRTLR